MNNIRLKNDKPQNFFLLIILIALSLILPIISLGLGFVGINLSDIWAYFSQDGANSDPNLPIVLFNIRLPRILAAWLIGCGLALAGSAYQAAFKNPLVSDNIIGVSHGASLGAALAMILGLNDWLVQIMAFAFGIMVVGIAYFIGNRARFGREISLILAGSMLSALAAALINMIKYIADPNDTLPAITYWMMGSLAKVDMPALLFSAVPIIIGIVLIFMLRWDLNILTLGDEQAASIGINPAKSRFLAVMAATIICSAAVCLAGQIGWVGLMIPHLARAIIGADHRKMLPVAALMGACFLLIMDNLARSFTVMEIPIGALTAIFGAPFFVILLTRRN